MWAAFSGKASPIDLFVRLGRQRGLEGYPTPCAVDLEAFHPDESLRPERNVEYGSPQKSREKKEQKASPCERTEHFGPLGGPRTASPRADERVALTF